MNILVFGAQGSGKSTHAKYIADKLKAPYIYTGDLFRELEKERSQRGRLIKRLMRAGEIIPNEISIPALEEYLKDFDLSKGIVLDGYPRNTGQAESLPIKIDLIVYIKLSEEIAIERLSTRGRYDDTPQAIKMRLEMYKKETQPVLNYFKDKGVKIISIDNTPPVDIVRENIDDLLKDIR